MSHRYTDAQILGMVDFVVEARNTGNPNYQHFLLMLNMYTNKHPRDIEKAILEVKRTGSLAAFGR